MVLPLKSLALLIGLALVPLAAARPQGGGTEYAFVSAEDDDLLVAVDLARRKVVARIRVANGPHNVAASSAGRQPVLVTSPPAGRVTLVSGRTRRVVTVFRGLSSPHDVELSADARYAYVTEEGAGRVAVLDLVRRRLVARVAVGARPHDLAVGDVLTVTHGRRTRTLTVLGLANRGRPQVIARIAAGGAAHDISKQPDSANVFVTYWNSSQVGGIDLGRRRVFFRKRLGTLLHHVQVDYFSGRHVWVTDHEGGRAFLVSMRTRRVVRSVGGCPGAHHVALFPRSRRAAIACHDSGRLLLFDPVTARQSSLFVGRGLHGVATALVP